MDWNKMALGIAMVALVLSASMGIYTYTIAAGLAGDLKSAKDTVNMLVDVVAPEGLDKIIAAKREGKLVWYTSYITEMSIALMNAFVKKYPFITVEYYRESSYVVLEKLMAEEEAGKVNCDVISLAEVGEFLTLKNKGYLLRYDSAEYAFYPKQYKDPGYWCCSRAFCVNIMYNTKLVAPGEVKHWMDLTDPKYKGKMTMDDPRISGSAYIIYYGLRQLLGPEFWQKMGQQAISIESGTAAIASKIATGEKWLGICNDYRVVEYQYKGAPVGGVFPEEGVTMQPTASAIVAKAPHPNVSKLFMDWMLGPDGAKLITELGLPAFGYYNVRIDSPAPRLLPPLSTLKLVEFDWVDMMSRRDELTKEFKRFFGLP